MTQNFVRLSIYILQGTIALWLGCAARAQTSAQDHEAFQSGREVFASGAYCWFADPRAVRHRNPATGSDKTYIGAIDTQGTVKALQYDAITGKETKVILDTDFQPDDHNNPTFLVLPDNRVMIFWSKHTVEPTFYYRVSTHPNDITELGERKSVSVEGFGNFTYPSPFYLKAAPDSFFLLWRGIRWHPTIAKYSLPDEEGNIEVEMDPIQIVQTTAARPYAKYDSNGNDRIYFSFTTGHPDNEMPNWLFYAELDVTTLDLHDVENQRLGNISDKPFGINQTTTSGPVVVDNPPDFKNWIWDLVHDGEGKPAIAMVRLTADARSHHYYHVVWTGSEWRSTFLADGGKWFHQHPRDWERSYSGGLVLDHNDTNTVYMSVPTEGHFGEVYEIWKAQVGNDGKLTKTQITKNSEKNNIRPYVVQNSKYGDPMHLIWMNGDYFYWIVDRNHPVGFPTRIMTRDFPRNSN